MSFNPYTAGPVSCFNSELFTIFYVSLDSLIHSHRPEQQNLSPKKKPSVAVATVSSHPIPPTTTEAENRLVREHLQTHLTGGDQRQKPIRPSPALIHIGGGAGGKGNTVFVQRVNPSAPAMRHLGMVCLPSLAMYSCLFQVN